MKLEVYKITNKTNGKVYVGITSQGVDVRWCKHCSDATTDSSFPIHNAIRKYGKDNFQIDILEDLSDKDYDYLKEREIYWIKEFDSYNREKGYNLTLGGDGTFGRFHSEETRDKIRQKALGRKASEQTKNKFRNRKRVNKIVMQFDKNNNFVNEFISCAEAGRLLNLNRHVISHCAKGVRKTAYGYIWKYKEDLNKIDGK